jgi:predicted ABC-type ATPase
MIDFGALDRRPVVVAIAGPNGAGKTTFFRSHLAAAGLRFINADVLAAELAVNPYEAARLADALRRAMLDQGESFIFETVFSDPVADKISFLEEAAGRGYTVVLCFLGLADPQQSAERVAMRVLQGGHDVPDEKLPDRYARSLNNLAGAISRLPYVMIFDNSDLDAAYRHVAVFTDAQLSYLQEPVPDWFRPLLP